MGDLKRNFSDETTCSAIEKRFKRKSNNEATFTTEELVNQSGKTIRNRVNFQSMDSYTRHKLLVNYYVLTHPDKLKQTFQRDTTNDKTDFMVLRDNHRFIWSEEELNSSELTWGQRVAKKYYEKLFKEYCIIDLSRFVENKFGMRWRTEPELVLGKGQFICGEKHCPVKAELTSWEVLFSYCEMGEKKSALIKVRLCPDCSYKLNYNHKHKKAKKHQKAKKKSKSNDNETSNNQSTSSLSNHQIKEEILSESEENDQTPVSSENDSNYQDLIDKIWKQPIKLEPEETETTLENEVDDYLNNLFM
ncbi:hypothetical protein RDWZM_001782 [Blomia tropicalis]|uniref:Protein FRA10AC1 n=1 Tax=Blomia tropicalis TaxID=40697 RepID=A0A9Q0MCS7_BLOTA|nr:hypothetical protein BLOT_008057 [Blomia tropicalis]KAJ6223237.1 hypothetical protein RDWZM_001782 [Blomia tropicalis]